MKPKPPQRVVVKVGTSTLTDGAGCLDRPYIADLVASLAAQRAAGRDVVLVSSGAIQAGRDHLARTACEQAGGHEARTAGRASPPVLPQPASLPYKQAAAAVGQGLLMRTYTDAFAWRNTTVAQVLLTRDDLADRQRFLNARNTLMALLALGVVPVINENDTVAVEEIRFGDNDNLAALVAVLVEADLLVILSDVEGLYTAPPDSGHARADLPQPHNADAPAAAAPPAPAPTLVRTVRSIDATVEAAAGGAGGAHGTGGMRTKIEAAQRATASGIRTVIACGRRPNVVADVVAGEDVGTTFLPRRSRLRGRRRWIAAGSRPRGVVVVNAGAVRKLREDGVSLLAVGVTALSGAFASGDLVEVRDEAGRRFARGLVNYGADDLRRIIGLHTDELEAALGSKPYDEVIHRDNLVVEG